MRAMAGRFAAGRSGRIIARAWTQNLPEWISPSDHGITFEQGAKAIADPFEVERIDDRENYGEERVNLLGMCDGALLHVTYTERGERI